MPHQHGPLKTNKKQSSNPVEYLTRKRIKERVKTCGIKSTCTFTQLQTADAHLTLDFIYKRLARKVKSKMVGLREIWKNSCKIGAKFIKMIQTVKKRLIKIWEPWKSKKECKTFQVSMLTRWHKTTSNVPCTGNKSTFNKST